MKFKSVLPYLLFGSLLALPRGEGVFHETDLNTSVKIEQNAKIPGQDEKAQKKAKELCSLFIQNVLDGQKRIKQSKKGHACAVLDELPGASVRWYCMYGQYTQLNRALDEFGDTLCLIPRDAKHSCPKFRSLMMKKYNNKPGYDGALHSGKMYKSDVDYNHALNAYLAHHNVTDTTPENVRKKFIERFQKNNFSIEVLNPGAIIIVQYDNSPSNTHAIMYLGRGCEYRGKFVSKSNGQFMFAGYNNESVGDIFMTFNTERIFVADVRTILTAEYKQQLQKIESMSCQDLFHYVYGDDLLTYSGMYNIGTLREMATKKWQNHNYIPSILPQVATASIVPFSSIFGQRQK